MPKTKALAAASSTKSPARKRAKPAVRSASAVSRRLRQIEDKRSAILGAALGLFSRFGLHGTSIDLVPLQEATRRIKTVPRERYEEAAAFFG